jgi:hypothetical protein
VFDKYSSKMKVIDYLNFLTKASERVDKKMKSTEAEMAIMTDGINSEEDFEKYVEKYGKLNDRWTIMNDIKYQLGTELKTKQSE